MYGYGYRCIYIYIYIYIYILYMYIYREKDYPHKSYLHLKIQIHIQKNPLISNISDQVINASINNIEISQKCKIEKSKNSGETKYG